MVKKDTLSTIQIKRKFNTLVDKKREVEKLKNKVDKLLQEIDQIEKELSLQFSAKKQDSVV